MILATVRRPGHKPAQGMSKLGDFAELLLQKNNGFVFTYYRNLIPICERQDDLKTLARVIIISEEPQWPNGLRRWFANATLRETGFRIPPLPRAEFGQVNAGVT